MIYHVLLLVAVSAATLSSQAPEADTFKFREGIGQALDVTLEDADATTTMTWPATADREWVTALLDVGVNVAARRSGAVCRDDGGRPIGPTVLSSGRDRITLAQP